MNKQIISDSLYVKIGPLIVALALYLLLVPIAPAIGGEAAAGDSLVPSHI